MTAVRGDRVGRARAGRARSRGTDRVEDVLVWLLMSAGLVLLVGSWTLGLSVQMRMGERAGTESLTRTEVRAVLLEAAPSSISGPASAGPPVRAAARWIGVDGEPHTGRVEAVSGARAGSGVTVWVDRDGTVTTPPTSAADARVAGVLVGFDVLLLGAAALVGVWIGVRRLTSSVNAVGWEREWAQVEPDWRRRVW